MDTELQNASKTADHTSPLPDFCHNQVILTVILIAQLLAIVLSLSQTDQYDNLFDILASTSLFIQCIALSDAALLCWSRRWLEQIKPMHMGILIYLSLQSITVLITFVSQHIVLGQQAVLLWNWPDFIAQLIKNVCISAIITAAAMRYFYIKHQSKLRQRMETESRVQSLQARIRPHFLFNSLNTIANLVHDKPDQAEDAIVDLAELFRSTLVDRNQISLSEELHICRRYLHIEQLRLGDRLLIDWNIQDDLKQTTSLPALVLQPLIENAIYHGIEPLPNGGTIKISISKTSKTLKVEVINPLKAPHIRQQGHGNQIAVDNIKQRLALAYAGAAEFNIEQDEHKYCVTMFIPMGEAINESINR